MSWVWLIRELRKLQAGRFYALWILMVLFLFYLTLRH